MEKTYNGWANYATWRVNLEVFDGLTLEDLGLEELADATFQLADALKDHVEMGLGDECRFGSLAYNYALAFISDVNWFEIADHLAKQYEEEKL